MFDAILNQAADQQSYHHYLAKIQKVFSTDAPSLAFLDASSSGKITTVISDHSFLNMLVKGCLVIQDIHLLSRFIGVPLLKLNQEGLFKEEFIKNLLMRTEKLFQADLSVVFISQHPFFKKRVNKEKLGIFLAFKYKKALNYKLKFVPLKNLNQDHIFLVFFLSFWEFIQKEKNLYQEREI